MKWIPAMVVLFVAVPAHALCVGTVLNAVPATATFSGGAGEYSVFDTGEYMQSVNFQVQSVAGIGGCKYYVTLDAGSSSNPVGRTLVRGGDTLNYNAYDDAAKSNILNNTGSYNGAGVISGNFPFILSVLQTNNHTLYWTIAPQQVVLADTTRFEDVSVTLRVWAELALGIYTNSNSKTITFRARAESDVDLSLVDSGATLNLGDTSQSVDFGALSSGEMLSYDTLIRSNDGYLVTLQSQNAQVMQHSAYPVVSDTVPYSVSFGGSPVNLSGGGAVTAASSTGTTPATGARFSTDFTVGTLSGGEPAGTYQDVITVDVSAN